MFGLTIWHWLLVLVIVVALFGSGILSPLLRRLGQGFAAFRKGMSEGSGGDAGKG